MRVDGEARLLMHDIPVAALDLAERVRRVVATQQLPNEVRSGVLDGLRVEVHALPRLVLTGQYSSGKSLLIRALTDGEADVVVGSDIATDEVVEHDWAGVLTLVDTPGVQAGVPRHDADAEQALAESDLVLFTVTVDLFDDSSARHLRYVCNDLGKGDQTVVVVTMASKMTADPGIREASLRQAFGSGDPPPLVECDALEYMKALAIDDPHRAAALRRASGVDHLRHVLNTLAHDRGELGRYRQPLQHLRAAVSALLAETTEDPQEKVALDVLVRQTRALASHRQALADGMERAAQSFRESSIAAGSSFADRIEALEGGSEAAWNAGLAEAQAVLHGRLAEGAESLAESIRQEVDRQMADLRAEMAEIGAGPQARWLIKVEPSAAEKRPGFWARRPRPATADGPDRAAWLRNVQSHLADFDQVWGGAGNLKDVAGGFGHQAVLDIGHMFGKKFRPWEAVKVARAVGRAMRVAGVAIQVGTAVLDVYQADQAARRAEAERHERRSRLVEAIHAQADRIVRDTTAQVWGVLDPLFEVAEREIDDLRGQVLEAQGARSQARAQLLQIDAELNDWLAQV